MRPFELVAAVCAASLIFVGCEPRLESGGLEIVRVEHYKETEQFLPEPVDRISVVLSNGRALKVPLYAASAISILTAPDGSQFLLAAGSDCTMCDEGKGIRFFPLGRGELQAPKERYTYPGILKDYMSQKLVQKARVFHGRCLDEPGDLVVWMTEYVGDDAKWQKATEVARLAKTGETLAQDNRISIEPILKRVATHECKELPGIVGTTEP